MKETGIEETFKSIFEKFNIEFFMGGSRAFGFNIESSDWDFIINTGKDEYGGFNDLKCFFNKIGFVVENDHHKQESYHDAIEVLKCGEIHIIITNNDSFNKLKMEHQQILKKLEMNPILVSYITNLKKRDPNIRGAHIYRAIRDL